MEVQHFLALERFQESDAQQHTTLPRAHTIRHMHRHFQFG
jgi:hypothetical protein